MVKADWEIATLTPQAHFAITFVHQGMTLAFNSVAVQQTYSSWKTRVGGHISSSQHVSVLLEKQKKMKAIISPQLICEYLQ